MKVAILTHSVSRRGGGLLDAIRRPAQLLHALPEIDVDVFAPRDNASDADTPGWAPVRVHTFDVRTPRAIGYAPGMPPAVDALGADLLHLHGLWQYTSSVALRWSRRTGRPHIVSPHGMLDPWAITQGRLRKRVAAFLYERANLDTAACVHALCEPEAAAIREFGVRVPICVIPNGVDMPPPMSASTAPSSVSRLLYLGRIHPKKGLPALLEAWASLRAHTNFHGWVLDIVGWDQDEHQHELQSLARELDIAGSVSFTGPRFGADKDATYRSADAFILPSLSEGLPMVVLEAWAHGLPVLATAACNLPEGFEARAAMRIDPDPGSIRAQLEVLFSMDPSDRRAMGARGRALVERSFTWPAIAGQFAAVYRWAVSGGVPPASLRT